MQSQTIDPHVIVDAVIESSDMKAALKHTPPETPAQVLAAVLLSEDVLLFKRFWEQVGPGLTTQERVHAVMMCSEDRDSFMLAMTLALQDRPTGTNILSLMFLWIIEQLLDMPDRQVPAFEDLFEFYSIQAYWLLDVQAMSNAFIGDKVSGVRVEAEKKVLEWMKTKAADLCSDIDSAHWLASNYIPKALSCDALVESGKACLQKLKSMPSSHMPSILGQSEAYENVGRYDPGLKQLAEAGFKLRVNESSLTSIAAAEELIEHGHSGLLDRDPKPEVLEALGTARSLWSRPQSRIKYIHPSSIAMTMKDSQVKPGDVLMMIQLRRVSYRPYFVVEAEFSSTVASLREGSTEHTIEAVLESGAVLRNSQSFQDAAGGYYYTDLKSGDDAESHLWRRGIPKCLTDDFMSIVCDDKPCVVYMVASGSPMSTAVGTSMGDEDGAGVSVPAPAPSPSPSASL